MVSDAFMSMGGDSHDDRRLEWSTIRTKLKSMGEGISDDELVHCLEVRGLSFLSPSLSQSLY